MNKDPAIERMIAVNELTEILCGKPCDICRFYGQRPKCMPVYTAEKIVDAGWRKASDVINTLLSLIVVASAKQAAKELTENIQKKYTEDKK